MIQLVVQADDFGMCHAVNQGIVRAFREGIVTQSSVMAPCPWFDEAVSLTREHAIPVGMHCTLTCEWEYLRWGPLTDAPSLRESDGGLWRTVADVRAKADPAEASAELSAQADRMLGAGLDLRYFDCHMGPTCKDAFSHVCEQYDREFIYAMVPKSMKFDSYVMLSGRSREEKLPWLLEHIAGLGEGRHFICTHPAEAGEELRSITPSGNDNFAWAEEFRASDLDVLCAPDTRQLIEERNIELVAVPAAGA